MSKLCDKSCWVIQQFLHLLDVLKQPWLMLGCLKWYRWWGTRNCHLIVLLTYRTLGYGLLPCWSRAWTWAIWYVLSRCFKAGSKICPCCWWRFGLILWTKILSFILLCWFKVLTLTFWFNLSCWFSSAWLWLRHFEFIINFVDKVLNWCIFICFAQSGYVWKLKSVLG